MYVPVVPSLEASRVSRGTWKNPPRRRDQPPDRLRHTVHGRPADRLEARQVAEPALPLPRRLVGATNTIHIHQAVPVRLTPDHALSVPHEPNSDGDGILQLKLPRNTSLKTLLEQSKHSASVVYLSGKTTGELVVTMHTDSGAHVQSYFRNLAVVGGPRDKTTTTTIVAAATTTATTTTVKVDIRKLTACLHTFPCDICLVENEMLLLHSDTDGGAGRVIYSLPVHLPRAGRSSVR
jgi:Hus1-like protein